MTILSVNNLNKAYGTDVILNDISFHVNFNDRCGIVGRNGEGKSTLLNILTGNLNYDSGDIFFASNIKVGYLKQRDNFDLDDTVIESINKIFSNILELEKKIYDLTVKIDLSHEEDDINELINLQNKFEELGGYTYKKEITNVLSSMGFNESTYNTRIGTLSGGERTRLALSSLLLEKPDLLLLDEPTNHLDIDTLKWLEGYLSSYKGTIIVVSHDRYFLDKVTNKIFEISRHKLKEYKGNYSSYVEKRKKIREDEYKAYINQQKEIKRQEDMIRIMMEHNTEHLVKRAQSRVKRLDMIERLEEPEAELKTINFKFNEDFKSGEDVLLLKDLRKDFSNKPLFKGVNLDLKRKEKICIVGENGIGKTTLLKVILGKTSKTSGDIRIGHNVKFGYYDQGQMLLNEENTLLNELKDEFRMYSDTEMRKILGRFLFTGDEVFLKVKDLSGGEKARLALSKLMLSGANTLILDEPTNHMDIESKEVFEEALLNFPGTAIIVSHDRYFLRKIPNRILELSKDGLKEYLGNYDYYLEKKEEKVEKKEKVSSVESKSNLDRMAQKELERNKRRNERKLEETEKRIKELEEEINRIEVSMSKEEIMTDFVKLTELSQNLKDKKDEINEAYKVWESLV